MEDLHRYWLQSHFHLGIASSPALQVDWVASGQSKLTEKTGWQHEAIGFFAGSSTCPNCDTEKNTGKRLSASALVNEETTLDDCNVFESLGQEKVSGANGTG